MADLTQIDSATRDAAELADVVERLFILVSIRGAGQLHDVARYLEKSPRIRDILDREPHEKECLEAIIKYMRTEAGTELKTR